MSYSIPGLTKYIKIPKIFHSDATRQQFRFCLQCNKFLLDPDTMYVIEKAIRRYSQYDTSDTIVEYAMCMDCNEGLKDSFSEISQKRLEQYFEENIDYDRRVDLLQDIREDNVEILLSKCAIKNTSADESEHYQLLAICKGEDLVVHLTPFMLSEEALDEMTDLLSNQTIGAIDDFIGQFLGLPPEFEDINKKLFII